MSDARALLWPVDRRDELVHALARAGGVARPGAPAWFRVDEADAPSGAAPSRPLRARAPAFFRIEPAGAETRAGLLAIAAWESDGARVLAPDGRTVTLAAAEVARLLRAEAEARVGAGLERLVARAALAPARAVSVHGALLAAALAGEPLAQGWQLRSAAPSLAAALREAGLGRRLALAALGYGAELALLVVAWGLLGARLAPESAGGLGWLAVLAAFVAARLGASWLAGRLAVDAGHVLRARLMDGLLALDTEPLRAEGVGALLGRVMETSAVEALALGGGLLAVAGLFELLAGSVVLALAAPGPAVLGCLAVVLALAVALAARFWRALGRWSTLRLALTHDLVERMAGHRTLVAQQAPELRHRDEERALDDYARAGRALDGAGAALAALVPRGWLLVGLAALAPALAAPASGAPGPLAASLGGVLFVYGALRKLTRAFPSLGTAALAWRRAAPLFASAGAAATPPPDAAAPRELGAPPPLVAARGLQFRYAPGGRPVLDGATFELHRGERVLLEGPSGGGKSTLAALLAGLRAPDGGTLTLDGVAQSTLGLPRWRARVAVVPQFHENHVLAASVLFNLLMGRAWPPRKEDVAEAQSVCAALELDGVLGRMPSGLEQLVGQSGWELSHGERSRLFIARALLQRLDVRILDESFAALDPETLERVLAAVLARTETLVVIAHP